MEPDPLARLIDIRLPPPPADPTGFAAALVLAGAVALLVGAAGLARLRARWYPPALAALAAAAVMEPGDALFAVAVLLRRVCLTLEPDGPARRAEGDAFRALLDRLLRTRFFSGPEGALLDGALHRPDPPPADAVRRLCAGSGRVLARRSLMPW
jgi:hypothetical protein